LNYFLSPEVFCHFVLMSGITKKDVLLWLAHWTDGFPLWLNLKHKIRDPATGVLFSIRPASLLVWERSSEAKSPCVHRPASIVHNQALRQSTMSHETRKKQATEDKGFYDTGRS